MNVNPRPDMIRTAQMPQSMMGLNQAPFMQNSPQPGPMQPMGMPPNPTTPQMNMMQGAPGLPNAGQRFPMPMQGGAPIHPGQPRPMMSRPNPNGQPMNQMSMSAGNMSLPPGTQMQYNTMPSGNNMRRVSSQGQMNPASLGIPPNVANSMQMSMNAATGMPGQIRQAHAAAQQNSGPPQHPMRPMNSNPMPAEMMRTPAMPPAMSGRPNQIMNSLPQPPAPQLSQQQPHQGGMPLQGNFPNSNMPPPLSSSPHPGNQPQPSINMQPMQNDDFFYNSGPFPPGSSNQGRMLGNNGQFPFTSTDPSNPSAESMTGLRNSPGLSNRPMFQVTPAQQYMNMQPTGNNTPTYPNFAPPQNHPPRPLSHNTTLPPGPPAHHPSPMSTEPMYRPPSSQQQQARTPSSGPGPGPSGSTPRPPSLQLGNPTRQPVGGPQPPLSAGNQPMPIAPRPPAPTQSSTHASPASSSTQSSSDPVPHPSVSIPRQPPNLLTLSLGTGQGVTRLLQFSGLLSNESKAKMQLSWWTGLIEEYFTPKAVMKFTLWRDNQRNEAKPFEIGVPILPRFFLVTTQSGVKSMTLTLDGARERMLAHGHAVVECVTAVWTYKYTNGYTIMLRGPLTAHVVITQTSPPGTAPPGGGPGYLLKFDDFHFDANYHDKYIALDAIAGVRQLLDTPDGTPRTPAMRNPTIPSLHGSGHVQQDQTSTEEPRTIIENASIPGEPVNAFGIPQATMRCLELAESVVTMSDLISFSSEFGLGPFDALKRFSHKISDSQGGIPLMNGIGPSMMQSNSLPYAPYPNTNGATPSPSVTLYSSAPPSVMHPASIQAASAISPPSSPQKQHQTVPPQTAGPSSTPGSTVNTPALSTTTLKRKQASESTSPTTATSDQPPPKRNTRKRTR